MRLHEQGECSQNRLGRLASMDVATIKGVVDRLLRKGLVASKPDPNDKRRMLICLSEKGAALIPSLHETGHEITTETLKPLSSSEQRSLLKLLRKLT
jgi:DNA-binding MarR family transcriptional regulator